MINNQIKEGRDSSIDMAKGILIAMLIFHHIVDVCAQLDVSNIVISAMRSIQKQMIVCYFMPAFFMITGICSNFNKPFFPFVKNQVKSLLIPAVSFILLFHIYQGDTIRQLGGTIMRLFIFGKDYWFLIALFEAKLLYWILNKYVNNSKEIIVILLALSFIGSLLNTFDVSQNFFMHRHVFDLTLYLGVGNMAKSCYRKQKVSVSCLIVFVSVLSIYTIVGIKIPYVTYTFATPVPHWVSHVLLSISGSYLVLWLSRSIKVDALIEYMGKNSLVIFLIQWYTLFMFLEAFETILSENKVATSISCILAIFISTISIGLFVAYIINNTKMRFLIGKF